MHWLLITPPEAERWVGIVRCGGVARIAVAAVVPAKAVTNNGCGACPVDGAANCPAICPSVDARNAQGCSRSSYSGFSTGQIMINFWDDNSDA